MIRRNNEAQTASETNSTNDVGPAPDQAGYQLDCTEVWGGNNVADKLVKVPGLVGLTAQSPSNPQQAVVTCTTCRPATSVCSRVLCSRMSRATVKPSGKVVKKYINTFDQSALMREINEAFYKQNEDLTQYATAVVLSHDCRTGELIFASAGHPPTLWYHASQKEWDWVHERTTDSVETFEGLPLGLVPETEYEQTRVRLAEGDLLILYTDGITECVHKTDKELGFEGLRELLRSLPVEPPIVTASRC